MTHRCLPQSVRIGCFRCFLVKILFAVHRAPQPLWRPSPSGHRLPAVASRSRGCSNALKPLCINIARRGTTMRGVALRKTSCSLLKPFMVMSFRDDFCEAPRTCGGVCFRWRRRLSNDIGKVLATQLGRRASTLYTNEATRRHPRTPITFIARIFFTRLCE